LKNTASLCRTFFSRGAYNLRITWKPVSVHTFHFRKYQMRFYAISIRPSAM
jgi:hypothetical protein